jgi:hypothetical protein
MAAHVLDVLVRLLESERGIHDATPTTLRESHTGRVVAAENGGRLALAFARRWVRIRHTSFLSFAVSPASGPLFFF